MKINLFKQIEYKPQSITSIASTDSKIYLFRSNKSCEVLDSMTLQVLTTFNTDFLITKSLPFKNSLICISELDEIISLNLENFSISINKIGYKITDFIIQEGKLILTTYNGFVLEINEDDIQVKFKTNGILNCILNYDNFFLVGGLNMIYILDNQFTIKNEINQDFGLITNIVHVTEDKFGFITNTGLFIYFDINLLNIIQKIQVRDSALNVLLIKEGIFYTSGMDSRLISYKLINDNFVKGYQLDLHFGISKCAIFDHNRILVGNTDGILSILIPGKDKYKYTKIYDRNVQVKSSKDRILINNRKCLELFDISTKKNSNINRNVDNNNCTFKISKDINFSVKNLPYKNLLRIYSKFATSCELEDNRISYIDSGIIKEVDIDTIIEIDNELEDYKLIQEESYDITRKYKIYHKNTLKKEIETTDLILKLFIFENEIWYFTQTYLYNVERDSRFDLEAVIYDVIVSNKKLIVIKDDWKYIKNYVEQGVFKKKYSTK